MAHGGWNLVQAPISESILMDEHRGLPQHLLEGRTLPSQLRKIMFDSKNPVVLSKDHDKMKSLMSTFRNHEGIFKKESCSEIIETLDLLTEHMSALWEQDFILHLLIVYFVHKKRRKYDNKWPWTKLIIEFIDKVEQGLSSQSFKDIVSFTEQKDCMLYSPNGKEDSVFFLAEQACSELASVSKELQEPKAQVLTERKFLYEHFIFSRMLWVSLEMKFIAAGGKSIADDLWSTRLNYYRYFFVFDNNTIQSLKKGIEVGKELELPEDCSYKLKHLLDLFITPERLRPFSRLMCFMLFLDDEGYLDSELIMVLKKIKYWYIAYLCQDKLSFNVEILCEGIGFLDPLYYIMIRHDMDLSDVEKEVTHWLKALLQLVDIREKKSIDYFNYFIQGREAVLVKYLYVSQEYITDAVKKKLYNLSIDQFTRIYQSFVFLPDNFCPDYLKALYPSTKDIDLSDPSWNTLFCEVVGRLKHAHQHYFLADFLQNVAEKDTTNSRRTKFIINLLKFNATNLLSVSSDRAKRLQDKVVQNDFVTFLEEYIKKYALEYNLCKEMPLILECVSNSGFELHVLIVNVLCERVIPELDIPRNQTNPEKKFVTLQTSKRLLTQDLRWLFTCSPKQSLCLEIVATCCSKINISTKSFNWYDNYSSSITILCSIFKHYCERKQLKGDECIFIDHLPDDLSSHPSKLERFFKWVAEIQKYLRHWNSKLYSRKVSYGELKLYVENEISLNRLSEMALAESLLVPPVTADMKNDFLVNYDLLNVLLLKYIPGQSEFNWCTLSSLLEDFGVCLPQDVQNIINKLYYPRRNEERKLGISLKFPKKRKFQPGNNNVMLRIHEDMTLSELVYVVQKVKDFQKPFEQYLKAMVFFRLKRGVLFEKYVHFHLAKLSQDHNTHSDYFTTSMRPPSFSSQDDPSTNNLVKALKSTEILIHNILHGTATYSDITMEDDFLLHQPSREKEFAIFAEYIQFLGLRKDDCKGLSNVRSMFELFQFTTHFKNMQLVFEKYRLDRCSQDPKFIELAKMMQRVLNEDECFKITPLEASGMMGQIKLILGFKEETSSQCLNIFDALTKSTAFHEFIKEKQYHERQAIFMQQYDLITAQLQHEDYEEGVLNHLRAAFKVVILFMDARKDFNGLMSEVIALDASIGVKHLETINDNIILIKRWFAQAEGNTLENVAKDLEYIVNTGCFKFEFGEREADNREGRLLLEYKSPTPTLRQITTISQPEGSEKESEVKFQVKSMNIEQVKDFVRKLGFMDKEKKGGDKIKHFLHLSQIMYKVFDLYQKLQELGYYYSCSKSTIKPFMCSNSKDTIDRLVSDTQVVVEKWRQKVSDLRICHNWLLYFCMPKLMHLYRLIESSVEVERVDLIIHEVSFLTTNSATDLDNLRERVLERLSSQGTIEDTSPMLVVGEFLDALLHDHVLVERPFITSPTLHDVIAQPLYFCPEYSQVDFLCFILTIFSGVLPEAYQVLRCKATTTEEELGLFLKRADHNLTHYLMLNVNMLPYKLQEHMVQKHLLMQKQVSTDKSIQTSSIIHYVETSPSILREMPWVQLKEDIKMSLDEAKQICMKYKFPYIELVYGYAGDGKTHYIKEQLSSSPCTKHLTIAVNEAFTPLYAISKLRSLPLYQRDICLYFNFTLLPPGDCVTESERKCYQHLLEVIGWFFFDLLLLGYVEDANTGLSFHLAGGLGWSIYIEVPSRDEKIPPQDALKLFMDEIPVFHLLGTPHYISPDIPFTVNDDVQLVCKYLHAYNKGEIDRLFLEPIERLQPKPRIIKFSEDPNLDDTDCQKYLNENMSKNIKKSKATQQLFVKYMTRRCKFLDCHPDFNYNPGKGVKPKTNTEKLGSTMMRTMLKEVHEFCDPSTDTQKSHQQLIYDFKDREFSFGLISLHPEKLSPQDRKTFEDMGFDIPSMFDLFRREQLDKYLSRALSVELEHVPTTRASASEHVTAINGTAGEHVTDTNGPAGEPLSASNGTAGEQVTSTNGVAGESLTPTNGTADEHVFTTNGTAGEHVTTTKNSTSKQVTTTDGSERLTIIDESAYVLTLDFTIKMINIHERYMCGVPVIIEGETGVGKTKLIEILSKLWNQSHLLVWKKVRRLLLYSIKDGFKEIVKEEIRKDKIHKEEILENYKTCEQAIEVFYSGDVNKESLLQHCKYIHDNHKNVFEMLQNQLLRRRKEKSIISLLTFEENLVDSFDKLFEQADRDRSPDATACLLHALLVAQVKTVFHKINVHAALTPVNIKKLLEPIFKEARRIPSVTIFFDEINTSSCLGLFKEILVDKTFNGEVIPENVFVVAACNPHRGNSLASHSNTWVRPTYYVRSLHPTLKLLMWKYDALNTDQERDYVNEKMRMIDQTMPITEVQGLTELIISSQDKMREFAFKQLKEDQQNEAGVSSRSCVSQRDIQRVFVFYQWFKKMYDKHSPYGERNDYHWRAVLVSLGIVYYMRLNEKYRKEYTELLKNNGTIHQLSFSEAFDDELDFYMKQVKLPKGIAKTLALKENIFAIIVCILTRTPLIIVGAPGSSKTLSFKQAIANLRGKESKKDLFKDTDIFFSVDPYCYQCSRQTTSKEIDTVFSRAINRQKSHVAFNESIYCVVFMDEAGLPEESHESLKVLHYHLDNQEVSFLAITNHVLDAAKSNRAVSLFRPKASDEDLKILAKGCLCFNPNNPPPKSDTNMVVQFCESYSDCMKGQEFSRFFGLRDFIHFVNHLRRKRDGDYSSFSSLVLQALERNFNGSEQFEGICENFFKVINFSLEEVRKQQRGIIDVLKDSMLDKPQVKLTENEVRYKLIIDPSEDGSLVSLLFFMGVLERKDTKIFMCSNFPGDGEVQKINTIASIRHSAMEGYTVVMSQTDDIHESFYDLFNLRFLRIDDPDHEHGARYYTNIAIGAHVKPSRVHPNFQCVVVIKKSELETTPAPFLNRFEKYSVSHSSLLERVLHSLPPCMSIIIQAAKDKVEDFIKCVSGFESLYGFLKDDTLDSLILNFLPPANFTYKKLENVEEQDGSSTNSQEILRGLFQEVLNVLRNNLGFHIPRYCSGEMEIDAESVFSIIECDSKFESVLHNLTQRDAHYAVVEAFNVLLTASEPSSRSEDMITLTSGACMVVSLLQQLLVRLFTKRLMLLMTTEAVILNRNKIPSTYMENYLCYQAHFSLKKNIINYHSALKNTLKDSARSANKLLCFTRSSPFIHIIPCQFRDVIQSNTSIKTLFFEETEKLMIYKLSLLHSQNLVRDVLNDFVSSDTAEVFVLLANMQETSKKIINHIRIMIEEAELEAPDRVKVFVLLIHFSPTQFFQHCYPALFLKGWDHCYLDTIGQNTSANEEVDIQDWFLKCCCPSHKSPSDEPDALLHSLEQLLPQAVPILFVRLYFGNKSDGSFNSNMKASERIEALRKILLDRGLGKILCEKFHAYWKPNKMAEYLERAASFSKQRESTLNITDFIQTEFKALFFDFCVVMLTQANHSFNLDIIYAEDCPDHFRQLFLDVFKTSSTPKLKDLNLESNNLAKPHTPFHSPRFPFFSIICDFMEKVVEFCKNIANLQVNVLDLDRSFDEHDRSVPMDIETTLITAVTLQLQSQQNKSRKQVLDRVIGHISSNPDLWDYYFKDLIICQLKLKDRSSDTQGDIAHQLIYTFFESLHKCEVLDRIVKVHCYIAVHQLELAKMATHLRPLSELQMVSQGVCSRFPGFIQSSGIENLLESVKRCQYLLGSPACLSYFVITTLFNVITSAVFARDSPPRLDRLTSWFQSYLDIMVLPTFKRYIYASFSQKVDENNPEAELVQARIQAWFNIMQITFLVLQYTKSNLTLNKDLGVLAFQTLLNCYFTEKHYNLVLKSVQKLPSLDKLVDVHVVGILSSTSDVLGESSLRSLFEGVLSHFFSSERLSYSHQDVMWLLELINSQRTFIVRQLVIRLDTNLLKHYLARILSNNARKNIQPLQICHRAETRRLVGDVIMSEKDLGDPGRYIPVFYQSCPGEILHQNGRMQQPLCHLYFLTILEHLRSSCTNTLGSLINFVTSIERALETAEGGEAVLLRIELEAIIQVLIWQFAIQLDPDQPQRLRQCLVLFDDVNRILGDPKKEEDEYLAHAHGMLLTLHLMNILKSSRKLTKLMTNASSSLFRIKCLDFVRPKFKSSEERPHFLSFLQRRGAEFNYLYNKLSEVMKKVHVRVSNLTDITHVLNRHKVTTAPDESSRMIIWLVAYYEFYDKNIVSPELSTLMEDKKLRPYLKDECCVRLIQCFLNPDLMIEDKENIGIEQQTPEHRVDSIYGLFTPGNKSQSDDDLCHSLANMVAMVLGGSSSNHLWYHLFAPNELHKTYMTGFMYDNVIDGKDMLYDHGVELTPDGQLGREDYMTHACRGTYTLHSLYLLLWANFGAFCMALLTQPGIKQKIHGHLISESLPVRHYCVTHLRSLWSHLQNNLGLSDEERSFFVMKGMNKLYKLLTRPLPTSESINPQDSCIIVSISSINGICETPEELSISEKIWHTDIYLSAWIRLKDEFNKYSTDFRDDIFSEILKLQEVYPNFPSIQECAHSIIGIGDLQQYSENREYWLLTKFAIKLPRLEKGGLLLPDLVELYRWIHTNLSNLITRDQALSFTMDHVIKKVKENSAPSGKYLRELYDRVKSNYNRYVDGVRAPVSGHQIPRISDDTSLIHFLTSSSSATEPEDVYGCLYTVILDIIANQNYMIESLYSVIERSPHNSLAHLVPKTPSKIQFTEVNDSDAIVSRNKKLQGVSPFLQLLWSRHEPTPLGTTLPSFQLRQLEEDVVSTFISGKPLIDDDPTQFRVVFKFKEDQSEEQIFSLGTVFTPRDLRDMADNLPDHFKHTLHKDLLNLIEYKFHSASYHLLVEVVTGLRIIIGYLIKTLEEDGAQDSSKMENKTVQNFLLGLYSDCSEGNLSKIGIQSAPPSQISCLGEISLKFCYSCLRLFYSWVVDGYYDFSSLPFTLKTKHDQLLVDDKLHSLKTGPDLQKELQHLIDTLKHSENDIARKVTEKSDMPIVDYLIEYNKLQEGDIMITRYISKTVHLNHYVALRLSLRRSLLKVKREMEENIENEECDDIWSDFVSDLWKRHLPHLWEEELFFDIDTTHYGFQFSEDCNAEEERITTAQQLQLDFSPSHDEDSKPEENLSDTVDTSSKGDDGINHYSADDVADFLGRIQLSQYQEKFLQEEIDGELLEDCGAEELNDFGVESPLHQMKIMELFQRELKKIEVKYSFEHLSGFLKDIKLEKHIQTLRDNGIDGDMILKVEKEHMKAVLRKIGLNAGDTLKLIKKYHQKFPL